MYDRKLQETRTRKESQRFKNVKNFYITLLIIIILIIFFEKDTLGISQLIFGVKGVIIKGIDYDFYMSIYGFKKDYLKSFTIFNFGTYLKANKPIEIERINIKYIFFDKFEVYFKLRKKIAIIHEKGQYYFIDEEGRLWGLPKWKDIENNIVVFDIGRDLKVSYISFLKKYAHIISEIDYNKRIIYLKRGKVLIFANWNNLKQNSQILSYIYEILGSKKVLYLVKNKIMIK